MNEILPNFFETPNTTTKRIKQVTIKVTTHNSNKGSIHPATFTTCSVSLRGKQRHNTHFSNLVWPKPGLGKMHPFVCCFWISHGIPCVLLIFFE